MVYILFAAGIICVILGIRGKKNNGAVSVHTEGVKDEGSFNSYLTDRMLLEKLDSIDEKLDFLCSIPDNEQYEDSGNDEPDPIYDMSDINKAVQILKNQGVPMEQIATKLGVTKGEVLLRLGMKK